MQSTSQPTSPQTRSGTRVFVVGAGSATGDTQHKAPGLKFVEFRIISVIVKVFERIDIEEKAVK